MAPIPPTVQIEYEVYDVIIIGAGPCGLAMAARLQEETPSAIFTDEEHQRYHWIRKHKGKMALVRAHARKNKEIRADRYRPLEPQSRPPLSCRQCHTVPRYSTLVLDSSGNRWMERWHRLFRVLEIEQLRSPMFFHIDPGDRDGMLAYTQETGREAELWEIPGCVGHELSKHKQKKMRTKTRVPREVEIDERDRKDYYSPSTKLFADYCDSIAERYGLDAPDQRGQILHTDVHDIKFGPLPGSNTELFTISTSRGVFHSRAAVLAIGPGHIKNFPWNLSAEEKAAACHSADMDGEFANAHVREKIARGESTNVVVIGGGLSSAQIVDLVVRRGVTKVWYIMRSDLKVKHFDVSLNWVGKFKNYDKAVFWSADSDEERFEMLQAARNGGSITPRYHKIIKRLISQQRVSLHTRTTITDHQFDTSSKTWKLTTDPPIPGFPDAIDFIYFATGMRTDVNELPLLQSMKQDYPIKTIHGFPCLTDDLMWKEGVPLFVTGRLAALRLGPAGPNLEGARAGAERIAWALEDILNPGRRTQPKDQNESLQTALCGLGNRYAELAES